MKENLNKLVSIILVMLLLASTTPWTVDKHYCMGHLIDVSFFTGASDCGMDMVLSDNTSEPAEKKSCCDDQTIIVEGQDNLNVSFENLSLDQQYFLAALSHSFFNLFKPIEKQYIKYEHYPPPLLVKNIQLLDEVFLI